jgi:hypothetical protein
MYDTAASAVVAAGNGIAVSPGQTEHHNWATNSRTLLTVHHRGMFARPHLR